jgi:hypothetical protein
MSDYILDDRGSIPGRGSGFFFWSLCVQTSSKVHPASYPMGTGGSFPWVKARPGRDADHSPPSTVEIKDEEELYIVFSLSLHGVGQLYLTFYHIPINCRASWEHITQGTMMVFWVVTSYELVRRHQRFGPEDEGSTFLRHVILYVHASPNSVTVHKTNIDIFTVVRTIVTETGCKLLCASE